MTTESIWRYAPDSGHTEGQDLTGYAVVAAGGTVGRVEREAWPQGLRHLVVDGGMWIFGKSAVVPVGTIASIDDTTRRVVLNRTREEVRSAPRFHTDSQTRDPAYLLSVGAHFSRLAPQGTATA